MPVKPVMAAKISLFQTPRKAKWAISRAERHRVMAMANFTPITSLGSGGIWRFLMRLVKAFLTQSPMVFHPLLFFAFYCGCVFSADEEAV